ncbi:DUF7283 family protein [Halorientalis regularis]|jgi:hypothetical protein|uniref:Uncharacterized protein n=1 Tax=Halorientalis regularis TaxID=660518 RepID=A0A1G7IVC8_9EURY|nr:hypothetical protein [Halorientalis regularis]SDF16692.1 hypothetical protein SAMN05216218_104100 [Halorientalis regularis]
MFDAPVDTWYLWLGVATASALAFGVAVALPTTVPPDAQRAAATVDAVATSPHNATGEHGVDATAVEIGSRRIALRNDGGTAHAAFAYGPVTPVRNGTALAAVLRGEPPAKVFQNATAFRAAAAEARNRTRAWRATAGRLVVRRVTWEGVDVTLVGA